MRTASTLEQRAAAAGINEFTGFSNSELARRLHLWREDLRRIDEHGGGGSPREFPLERITDIEDELTKRGAGHLAT